VIGQAGGNGDARNAGDAAGVGIVNERRKQWHGLTVEFDRLILTDACRRQDSGRKNEGVQPVVSEVIAQMFL
jgi:hypothetical protein